jgi:hypothetical protein
VRLLLAVLISILPLAAQDLRFGTSTATVGVGLVTRAGGDVAANAFNAGPSFTGEYEFGLDRYLSATIGVENDLPVNNFYNCGRLGCSATRERFTFLPFGMRGTLPLGSDRAEIFGGAGGARVWTDDPELGGFECFHCARVLAQINGGVRFRVGRQHRFYLWPVVRMSRDLGRPTQVWLSVTGNLSYRFSL